MRASPRMLRCVGAAGLTLCLLAALLWYAVWLPFVNVSDPKWLHGHSNSETCAEIARVQRVWGWSHDMSLQVGSCDGEWVGRILSEAEDADDLESMDFHLGTSLQLLTGQDIRDNDLEAWRRWYDLHRNEPQDRWFRDAFAQVGIDLPAELRAEDVRTLLKWMGEKHGGVGPPAYVAFRLLRGQRAMTALRVQGPDSEMTPQEVIGLQWFTIWNVQPPEGAMRIIESPRWRLTPPCVLVVLAIVFSFVLGWSLRSAKGTSAPAGAQPD